MVVADRVFGLVRLDLLVCFKEDFAAPLQSVLSWCSLQSIDDTETHILGIPGTFCSGGRNYTVKSNLRRYSIKFVAAFEQIA
jgi:hypothetical protein